MTNSISDIIAIARTIRMPAVRNLNKPEYDTVLYVANASRVSHQHIRYEYNWHGYDCWQGQCIPAYSDLSDRKNKNVYIGIEQYDQLGALLAVS